MSKGFNSLYYDGREALPLHRTKQDDKYFSSLKPEFTMRYVLTHGTGMYPVNINTGQVCDCKMEWDDAGENLTCPVCGLDGT
jgi:hypothetical protein